MSFVIITDSASNLIDEQLNQYNIKMIPYIVNIAGKEVSCYESGEDNDAKGKEFYDFIRQGGEVTTSLVNPDRFLACFEEYLQQGLDVVFIGISSGLSGTCQSAQIAAEQLSEEYPERKCLVIDSLAASLGEGIMAIKLSEYRAAGWELEAAVEDVVSNRLKMACIFSVADLKYLLKGGRVSTAVAKIGSVLNIKPMLYANNEGKISLNSAVRGRKKALDTIVKKYFDTVLEPENQIIGIAHCDCKEDAEYIAERIREGCSVKDIIINCYDRCTGAHVGPDAIALFYVCKCR